jgi:AcrR family transcriptional regulator
VSAAAATRPKFAEASRSLLRDTVLDAAGELMSENAWEDVTMAAIAKQAGVSRQTLYNEFGSRLELAQTYVLREADRFLVAVEAAVNASGPAPREALNAALDVFLSNAETHPVIRAITVGEGGDELVTLVTTRAGGLVADVTERLAKLLTTKWPELGLADARLVSETLARLAISYAALPAESPKGTAESVTRVLGPFVDELVG